MLLFVWSQIFKVVYLILLHPVNNAAAVSFHILSNSFISHSVIQDTEILTESLNKTYMNKEKSMEKCFLKLVVVICFSRYFLLLWKPNYHRHIHKKTLRILAWASSTESTHQTLHSLQPRELDGAHRRSCLVVKKTSRILDKFFRLSDS
jgi:hypothetical protein